MGRLWLRFALCVYALMYAICLPLALGIEDSYSDYHSIKPIIFPIITIGVSFGLWLHRGTEWKIPAFLLIVVACFNNDDWNVVHNTAAILFFISSTYIMVKDKRFKIFGIISLLVYPFLLIKIPERLFLFELIQIPILATYHLFRVLYLLKLKNKL
tara:strand:+ start:267 stop:734 length:468 start_codon:yes stop_codon:yes gene_type:complete